MTIVQSIILLGGGGYAAVVAETARAAGFVVVGYLDEAAAKPDESDSPIAGFKRIGGIADLPRAMTEHRHAFFHAAIGENAVRAKWLDLPSPRGTPAIIHPSAIISPTARIEEGVFIGPRAVINARALIRRGAIVGSGAIVENDCVLEPFCHCGPGCVLAGSVHIGREAVIGAGAVIILGIKIGDFAALGAGAVAISDLPPIAASIGVPARTAD